MKYLNLGCGTRYLPEWTNVDFVSTGDEVQTYNLLYGIPFQDNTFEVVYHSHLLEHFTKENARRFIGECFRVLKKGGVIRIAVPDLERIVRSYLQQLDQVRSSPTQLNGANYDWVLLEMYDQTVRNSSGGEMGRYWAQPNLINEAWIAERMGCEFLSYRRSLENNDSIASKKAGAPAWKQYFKLSTYRKRMLLWLSGEPLLFELLQLARFRTGGEVHQWMYDSYSLGRLLDEVGFQQIRLVDASTSCIQDWERHQWLDVENGKVRKPDSLFIEAVK